MLPVMIGRKMKKGIFAFRERSGFDVWIVWLNKEYECGEEFDVKDIKKVNCILHFCDRDSLQKTVDVLNKLLKDWKTDESTEIVRKDKENGNNIKNT